MGPTAYLQKEDDFTAATHRLEAETPTTTTWCGAGVLSKKKKVCCPLSCGTCGGSGCSGRPGGKSACCGGGIRPTGTMCATVTDTACIVPEIQNENAATQRLEAETPTAYLQKEDYDYDYYYDETTTTTTTTMTTTTTTTTTTWCGAGVLSRKKTVCCPL